MHDVCSGIAVRAVLARWCCINVCRAMRCISAAGGMPSHNVCLSRSCVLSKRVIISSKFFRRLLNKVSVGTVCNVKSHNKWLKSNLSALTQVHNCFPAHCLVDNMLFEVSPQICCWDASSHCCCYGNHTAGSKPIFFTLCLFVCALQVLFYDNFRKQWKGWIVRFILRHTVHYNNNAGSTHKQCTQADGWINTQAMVISQRCAPCCRSTVFLRSRRRHRLPPVHRLPPEAIFDVNKRRDFNCNLLHHRREEHSSDCRQLHFEPGSAQFFSTPPLAIVWFNVQTIFNDFLEVYFTKMVNLSPNVQTDFTVQFNSVDLMTSSITLHSDCSVVSQLTNTVNMTIVQVCKYNASVIHPQ